VLARELYGRAPRAFLISLCGESFALEERLSPLVADAMPGFVRLVEATAELALA